MFFLHVKATHQIIKHGNKNSDSSPPHSRSPRAGEACGLPCVDFSLVSCGVVTGGRISAHRLTAGLTGWRGGQGLPSPSPLDGWALPEDVLT